jgi:hypothetical protein
VVEPGAGGTGKLAKLASAILLNRQRNRIYCSASSFGKLFK